MNILSTTVGNREERENILFKNSNSDIANKIRKNPENNISTYFMTVRLAIFKGLHAHKFRKK